jgi:hypothetical protein
VAGTFSYNAGTNTSTFAPTAALAYSTGYTLSLNTGVKDVAGNSLASPYVSVFTTVAAPDVTPPTVISTSPVNGAANVAVGTVVNITFSETMDAATLNTSSFVVNATSSGAPVTGSVIYVGASNTAAFTPSSPLAFGTGYTATVSPAVKDVSGNALTSAFTWTFATSAAPDVTPPTVITTSPTSGATNVGLSTATTATFSEAMLASTIDAGSVTLRVTATSAPVAGTVSYSAATSTVTFTPTAPLAGNTSYTASISTAVRDASGNALTSGYAWSFTTLDDAPPVVTSVSPADAATGVSVNSKVSVAFSEPMDPATINSGTIFLRNSATLATVAGVVAYNAASNTATFTPGSALSFSTGYTITVSTGAKDAGGNPLAATFTASFSTATAPDTTAPTVTGTLPTNGAGNVSVGTLIGVTFSEQMDPSTITGSSIALRVAATGAPVAGFVAYSAATNTAVFAPSVPLGYSTGYTIVVGTGAKDAAGNALAAVFTAGFTTVAAPDATPPTVLSTSPANGATNVAISSVITVTFSEAMDLFTIDAATVTLRNNTTSATVAGTFSYNAGTNTSTFAPTAALAYSTGYTLTLNTGVKDVAGNSLASPYVSVFTTVAAPDATPPTVISTSPVNGAANVAVGTVVNITFSETMDAATINGTTISLRNTATSAAVAGSVSFNGATNTATFTPASALAVSTGYTLTVSTGVKDAAGNALASPLSSTFTTVPPADTTPPTVVSTSPANSAVGVLVRSAITVTFSEPMNPATLNTASLIVKEVLTNLVVAGTVTYDTGSNTATFTPNPSYSFDVKHTITVTTAASDLAGNGLAASFSSTFTTIQYVGNLPYFQGTDANDQIHFHITFGQTEQSGQAITLGLPCPPLPQAFCEVFPLNQAGADAIGPPSPDQNGGALITALTGTFTDPGITFTFTLANGRTFTFTGTVTGSNKMVGTVSGSTLPPVALTLNRGG